ncbi:MAG: alcohol dehydrogenase, partial [Alphaproteobacteria bacterium]
MRRQSIIDYGAPLSETTGEVPVPQGSEVLVRVSHCGVCHSDIHLQDGYFDLGGGKQLDVRSGRELPFTLGHEIAGVVEAAGPQAEGLTAGEHCIVYPWIGCGNCALCADGDEHLCNQPRALGVTVDGGYASHVLVPHPRYILNAQGIAPEIAGSYMCSGLTAYSALRKVEAHGRKGPVMIVGLGGVGLMGLQFAKAISQREILAADIDAAKRETAGALGASGLFDPAAEDARKAVLKATGGGVAAAVDFAGTQSSLHFAQSIVGKGG